MMRDSMKWGLGVSLALNVFLIGGIAGGAYRWLAADEARAPVPPRGLRYVAEALPEPQRKALRAALREQRRESGPQIAAVGDGRREVLRLLAEPRFDRDAIEKALARTRQADIDLRAGIEGRVVDFASTLPAQERQRLAEALAERGPLKAPAAPAGRR